MSSDDNLLGLAEILEEVFPGLAPAAPLQSVGSGSGSRAVETPSGVLMRVGWSEESARGYALEYAVLPILRRRLGELVPCPEWYTGPVALLPHGAIGYKKLPGEHPPGGKYPPWQLAQDLGLFMARLHALSPEYLQTAAIPEVDPRKRLLNAQPVVMPVLEKRLSAQEMVRVLRWWKDFNEGYGLQMDRLAVCHHDLWHENLLIGPGGRLTGVLDWSHIELGDAAHDFAAVHDFGEPFLRSVVRSYRCAGGHFEYAEHQRARLYWEGRVFGKLAWAIEHGDAVAVDETVRKIRSGSPQRSGR